MGCYSNTLVEHLRLTILRLLAEQTTYSLNESLLVDLSAVYAFTPDRDRMRCQLEWLRDQGFVSLDQAGKSGIYVATLTQAGQDVATGIRVVSGVKRPGPGEV